MKSLSHSVCSSRTVSLLLIFSFRLKFPCDCEIVWGWAFSFSRLQKQHKWKLKKIVIFTFSRVCKMIFFWGLSWNGIGGTSRCHSWLELGGNLLQNIYCGMLKSSRNRKWLNLELNWKIFSLESTEALRLSWILFILN